MDVKILYISTERNNSLFHQEIQRGIDILQSELLLICSDLICITGISVSKSENGEDNNIECEILEKNYEWGKDSKSQCTENEISEINYLEAEDVNLHDYYKLSECVHKYADSCGNGSSIIYVLWCVQDYAPCPSEVVEFYGSLKRLHWWHNSSLNIITNNFDVIEDWITYLPFQVVVTCEEVIQNLSQNLWRGSLVFSVEGKNNLTPLAEVFLRSESKNFSLFNFCGGNKAGEKVYVLPTAEVFTEVDLRTIPWAFIQKDSLCFLAPSFNLMQKDKKTAADVLETLTQSEEVGTLFRIRYSRTPPSLHGLQATNTDTWKQTIAEGNFDHHPVLNFQGQHETIVFLMISKDPLKEWVNCVALTDPTSYGEDIVKLISQEELKPKVFSNENELKIKNLLRGTSEFSRIETYALANIFLELPNTIRKRYLKINHNVDKIVEAEKLLIECNSSKEILNRFIVPSLSTRVHPCDAIIYPEVSVPIESFPEYKALEEREKRNKNAIARCTSGDFLCGLPPPVITQTNKRMDVAQILKCFSEERGIIASQDKNSDWDSKLFNGDRIRKLGWRKALHLKYPGIYYNNGEQQEKFELRCNRLREQVIHETASNCSVFQNQESSSRPHQSKPKSNHGDSISRQQAFGIMKPSCHRTFYDSDSCSSKSFNVPLRRSPRKLIKDGRTAKPSEFLSGKLSRMNSTSSASVNYSRFLKPSDLTEIHKQKLRNVVLTVLETEGITMKHELFKLCFKKLFAVCRPFALDVIGQGATTRNFEKIAKSHVKQVVHFEKRKNTKR